MYGMGSIYEDKVQTIIQVVVVHCKTYFSVLIVIFKGRGCERCRVIRAKQIWPAASKSIIYTV